jgi:signal transduction histidine kinase
MDYDNEQAAMRRAMPDPLGDGLAPANADGLLLHRLATLKDEVARLRRAERERERERAALEETIAQLREANEHLVLATVNAESLREDAEAANRRQNEFLAMLAHELRNPLSPIAMAAAVLERMPDPSPQLLKMAWTIGRQVGHMARLLDDLLDAARISSGKITLAVEPLALADIIQAAAETVQPRVQERRQRLDVALPRDPVVVDGDRVRLTQVFTNLLNNASKYTGDGGLLRVAVAPEGAQPGDPVHVIVEDNGTGMAADVIPHIFDLFTQGPRSLARSEGGLGVGLNVVRNLVTMHRGSVTAESAGAGQGSRFTVALPVSGSRPAAGVAPAWPVAAARCRILLVEDNPDACDTLAALLRSEGHDVTCARDGQAGLAAALDSAFDVVVCDIGLPVLDGLDLMRALRASAAGAAPLAIALTGYGQADDQARGRDAGYDAYLVKPVDAARLLALIAAGR